MPSYNDKLTPFLLHESDVHGRFVRLGPTLDEILTRHDYPEAVSKLLAETLLVTSMLSANLKHEGIVTVQMKGKGDVRMVVSDAVYGGVIRGYADLAEGVDVIKLKRSSPRVLLGEQSYMAVTLDIDEGQRYQGVVELEGDSLTDSLNAYFRNSQQLDVAFKLAVGKREGKWVAGGAMIERLPPESNDTEEAGEAWHTAKVMLHTLKDDELLDESLEASELLYRLYHEPGVVVYDTKPISTACRCSRERIYNLLMSMPKEDREHSVMDGKVSVHCQFCNTSQEFTPSELSL